MTLGQKYQSAKQGNNVRAWLMDCENDSTVVCFGQGYQAFDNIERIEGILHTVSLYL